MITITSKVAIGIVLLLGIALTTGCGIGAQPSAAPARAERQDLAAVGDGGSDARPSIAPVQLPAFHAESPIRIAFLQDKTGSVTWTRTPQSGMTHVLALVALLRQTGGELGFGLIRDQSDRGLLRLRIELPPDPLPKAKKTGRVFADARMMEAYRKAKAAYEDQWAARQADSEKRVAEFTHQVESLLDQPADARRTDIWNAVRRADLFLAEDDVTWSRPTHRWAVFVTDGLHNTAAPPAVIRSNARVLVVNGAGELGCLAALQPVPFESIDAAVRHIQSTEGR